MPVVDKMKLKLTENFLTDMKPIFSTENAFCFIVVVAFQKLNDKTEYQNQTKPNRIFHLSFSIIA